MLQGHAVTLFASGDSETSAELVAAWPRALGHDPDVSDPNAPHVMLLDMVAREARRFDLIHFHLDGLHLPLLRFLPMAHLTTLHRRLDRPETIELWKRLETSPWSRPPMRSALPFRRPTGWGPSAPGARRGALRRRAHRPRVPGDLRPPAQPPGALRARPGGHRDDPDVHRRRRIGALPALGHPDPHAPAPPLGERRYLVVWPRRPPEAPRHPPPASAIPSAQNS